MIKNLTMMDIQQVQNIFVMQKIDFLGCDEEHVSRKEGKSMVTRSTNNVFAPQKTEASKKSI